MITSYEIRDAIAGAIKSHTNLQVYFNQVHDAAADYAFVSLRSERTDEGLNYFARTVQVDVQVVLAPLTAEVKHTDLLDVADALDAAFHGHIAVADRHITIYDTAAHIFDGVLHYEFKLAFADTIAALPEELAEYEFGEELTLRRN